MTLLLPATTALAASKRVAVKQAGTLSQVLTLKQQKTVTRLTVEGTLSATDFKVVRQMANKRTGKLQALDLSKARILTGEDIFKVPDSLFAHCDGLVELEMPDSLLTIGVNSFVGCSSLKRITFHNLSYISYGMFHELPSLETLMVTGRVVHIDSTPFQNLPKLQRVVFGSVISTGGPYLAQNCPLLQDVVFRGLVYNPSLTQLEGCPLLKECRVEGYLGYCKSDLYRGRSFVEGGSVIADSAAHVLQRELASAPPPVPPDGMCNRNLQCGMLLFIEE